MHRRGHAAAGVAREAGHDLVALGEAGHHEQTHAAGGVGGCLGAVREVAVELLELGRGHAEAGVGDGDGDATVDGLGRQPHGLRGRRVGQRVVDQLGEQVDQVGGRLVAHAGAEVRQDLHALVVLHARGRGLQRLTDGEAEGAGGAVGGVGQDEQRVGRAAHPRGEVVEAEQRLEALGVLLVVLQTLDLRELLVDQGVRAARERHEHRVDGLAELGLAGGEVDGLAVEVVDRSRDLSDLLVGGDVDRLDRLRLLAGPDPGDGVGQAVAGHRERALADLADRLEERSGDVEGDHDGDGEGQQRQRGAEEGVALRVRGRLVERGGDALEQLGGDLVVGPVGVAAVQVGGGVVTDLAGVAGVRRTQLGGLRLGAGHGPGETVDGGRLHADLREELLRAGLGQRGGDETLLHRQRQATAHGLGQLLEPRLGRLLGGVHAGDQLRDARLELADQGDPRGGTEVLRALAPDALAEVEQRVDVSGLEVGQVGVVTRLGQGLGVGRDVVDRVDQVALAGGAVGLRGDHRALGGDQVVHRGLDDGDLLGAAGGAARVGVVVLHPQAAEDGGEKQRDGQRERHLAAQRPAGDRAGRTLAWLVCVLSHVCLAIRERFDDETIGSGGDRSRLNLRSHATFRGVFAELCLLGVWGPGLLPRERAKCRRSTSGPTTPDSPVDPAVTSRPFRHGDG
ncbi:hypothetical protein NOZE110980_05960 [Nocardioides zeicaulis]